MESLFSSEEMGWTVGSKHTWNSDTALVNYSGVAERWGSLGTRALGEEGGRGRWAAWGSWATAPSAVGVWEAQTPWVTCLLPVDHTGALGNISGQEGHFGAGSCVTSQERELSLVSPGQLLGRDSWQGQRGQCFPSPTLEVAASSLPPVLIASGPHGLRCPWEWVFAERSGVTAVVHHLGHGAAYCRCWVGAQGRQSMPSLPSEAAGPCWARRHCLAPHSSLTLSSPLCQAQLSFLHPFPSVSTLLQQRLRVDKTLQMFWFKNNPLPIYPV